MVLLTTSFPDTGDGSEAAGAFVSDLAEELALRVPVRVVAPGKKPGIEKRSRHLEVARFAAPARPLSTLRPHVPGDLWEIGQVLRGGQAATCSAIESGPTQHVLALWALPSGHWARRASRRYDVPYSVWTLGSDIWSLGRVPCVSTYLAQVLRGADACYSDGLKLAKDTERIARREVEFLASTRRIAPSPMGASRKTPPYRLLFLGRWHPNKGIDILLDALFMLTDADWALVDEVHIAGGGILERDVESKVRSLVAAGRPVRTSGYLDRSAAAHALGSADRLLLPSRVESIPVVYSDAMKFGLPVVAMPVGDLPELIVAGTGWLSRSVDPHAFANAIQECLRSQVQPSALETMAGTFSLDTIANRLVARMWSKGTGRD